MLLQLHVSPLMHATQTSILLTALRCKLGRTCDFWAVLTSKDLQLGEVHVGLSTAGSVSQPPTEVLHPFQVPRSLVVAVMLHMRVRLPFRCFFVRH